VVYTLKTPHRDGTTQVAFEPVDFVARLAALVPKPRVNHTRYHGVLAPNHRCRGLITPGRRGKGIKPIANAEVRTAAERQGLPRFIGYDLGSATQASFQHRHRTLQPLRGDCEGHRLYRGPRRHR